MECLCHEVVWCLVRASMSVPSCRVMVAIARGTLCRPVAPFCKAPGGSVELVAQPTDTPHCEIRADPVGSDAGVWV